MFEKTKSKMFLKTYKYRKTKIFSITINIRTFINNVISGIKKIIKKYKIYLFSILRILSDGSYYKLEFLNTFHHIMNKNIFHS